MVRPKVRVKWPMPPPNVNPATPVLATVPLGVAIPIVPGINDDDESIQQLAEFIAATSLESIPDAVRQRGRVIFLSQAVFIAASSMHCRSHPKPISKS